LEHLSRRKYGQEGERRFGGKDWKEGKRQRHGRSRRYTYIDLPCPFLFARKEGRLDRPSVGPLLIRVLLEKLLCG
jgi:hypothetical protein